MVHFMPNCITCGKQLPSRTKIDNKWRYLKGRKRCFDCSPFGNKQKASEEQKAQTRQRKVKNVVAWRRKKKRELVAYKGGKCLLCRELDGK